MERPEAEAQLLFDGVVGCYLIRQRAADTSTFAYSCLTKEKKCVHSKITKSEDGVKVDGTLVPHLSRTGVEVTIGMIAHHMNNLRRAKGHSVAHAVKTAYGLVPDNTVKSPAIAPPAERKMSRHEYKAGGQGAAAAELALQAEGAAVAQEKALAAQQRAMAAAALENEEANKHHDQATENMVAHITTNENFSTDGNDIAVWMIKLKDSTLGWSRKRWFVLHRNAKLKALCFYDKAFVPPAKANLLGIYRLGDIVGVFRMGNQIDIFSGKAPLKVEAQDEQTAKDWTAMLRFETFGTIDESYNSTLDQRRSSVTSSLPGSAYDSPESTAATAGGSAAAARSISDVVGETPTESVYSKYQKFEQVEGDKVPSVTGLSWGDDEVDEETVAAEAVAAAAMAKFAMPAGDPEVKGPKPPRPSRPGRPSRPSASPTPLPTPPPATAPASAPPATAPASAPAEPDYPQANNPFGSPPVAALPISSTNPFANANNPFASSPTPAVGAVYVGGSAAAVAAGSAGAAKSAKPARPARPGKPSKPAVPDYDPSANESPYERQIQPPAVVRLADDDVVHKGMSRSNAESILLKDSTKGCFLIRSSGHNMGYVYSCLGESSKVVHAKVDITSQGVEVDARPVPPQVLNASSTMNDIVAYVSLLRKARGHAIAHMISAKLTAPSSLTAAAAAASDDGDYMTVAKSSPAATEYMTVSQGFAEAAASADGGGADTSEYMTVSRAKVATPPAPAASNNFEDELF